jgi:mRNA interferase RelE/StbE
VIYLHAVDNAINSLKTSPRRGKLLKGDLRHLRSLRVGVYRVIYRLERSSKTVIVETIRHRSEAYR